MTAAALLPNFCAATFGDDDVAIALLILAANCCCLFCVIR